MNVFKVINKQRDYIEAISRTLELYNAKPGTIEYLELEFLLALIQDYEDKLAANSRYQFFNWLIAVARGTTESHFVDMAVQVQ